MDVFRESVQSVCGQGTQQLNFHTLKKSRNFLPSGTNLQLLQTIVVVSGQSYSPGTPT